MYFLPLLLFGLCVNAHLVFGGDVKLNLDCNNDMETMFCQFEAKKCSEYNLTIQDKSKDREYSCLLQQYNNKCNCSKKLELYFNDTFTVKVCRGNKEVEVKTFDTTESFKARTPTIVSVKESNGNIEVRWKTNMEKLLKYTYITAEVTVYKQGDTTNQVSKNVTPPVDKKDLQYHLINGKDLDSDTAYRIRVRSFTGWNNMYSDSSEMSFITPSNSNSKVWILILSLSVFAVLLSAFLFWSLVKLKRKWWDIYLEPKMTISPITNPRVITNMPPTEISVCVTEEEMSKKLLFPEILVANQESGCSQELKNRSGSSDMFNKTYSLLLPNSSGQRKTDSFEVQSQTERFSGCVCSPNTSDVVNNPDRQAPLFPAQQDGSSLAPTEMSHRWCDACPHRVSHGIFGDTNTTTSGELKTGPKGFEMCCEKAFKHENPFYGCLPNNSPSFLSVKTDFQPVPSKVEQPDAVLLQKINASFEHLFKKYPEETFNKIPQPNFSPFSPGFINNTQNAQCQPGLLLPFLPMTSAGKTIEVISDYHGV